MERHPLYKILDEMTGTDRELDVILTGDKNPLEIRNVVDVTALESSHGLLITTRQNYIWLDASHVSAVYQARSDL